MKPPQEPRSTSSTPIGPWRVYAATLVALAVTGWLTTWRLVAVAENLPLGPGRDVAVTSARLLHGFASAAGLERPSRSVLESMGRTPPLPGAQANYPRQASAEATAEEIVVATNALDAPIDSARPSEYPWRPPTVPRSLRPLVVADSGERVAVTLTPEATAELPATPNVPTSWHTEPASSSTALAHRWRLGRDEAATSTATRYGAAGSPTALVRASPASGSGGARATLTTSSEIVVPGSDREGRDAGASEPMPSPQPRRWPADTVEPRARHSPSRNTPESSATPTRNQQVPTPRPAIVPLPIAVLVAGDSLAEPLGYEMAEFGTKDGLIQSRLEFRISSGLARPDYFDWRSHLEELVVEAPPDVVVWHSGGNDDQNLQAGATIATVGSQLWAQAYEVRVGRLMDAGTRWGSRLVWIGLPPIRDAVHNEAAMAMNVAAERQAQSRPRVRYLDLVPMFAGPDGAYSALVVGTDGELTRVRQDDGVHLTRDGTAWVADLVYGTILADFGLERPATP